MALIVFQIELKMRISAYHNLRTIQVNMESCLLVQILQMPGGHHLKNYESCVISFSLIRLEIAHHGRKIF